MQLTIVSHIKHAPLVALAAGVIVFACSSPDQTTAPARPSISDLVPAGTNPTPGVVTLCKAGADGLFSVQVGTGAAWSTIQMGHNSCQTIASMPPVQADDVIVTITEQQRTSYALDHIVLKHGTTAEQIITNSRTVSFEGTHGAIVTYFNNAIVNVCKHGTAATFQYQVGLGASTQSLSLADGECRSIASIPPAGQDDVIVTVRENPSAAYKLDHIGLLQGFGSEQTIAGQSSVSFEGRHGATVHFYNVPVTATACTFTQGYYKNKGASLLPSGNFYSSGQTYLQVLETAPKGGNPYYILAHQYIAAWMNAKSGSVPGAVQTALTQAAAYFASAGISPNAPTSSTYTKEKLTAWADLLGSYNEGQMGPSHCKDE